jgi:CheY-like chemotaxis protein
MHILVVDDDEDAREVLALILRSEGHRVEEAIDGLDALTKLHTSHPALILLDMMMPRLDGEGLMRAMKRDPRIADTPVVIISGHEAARQKAGEVGAAGCLVKPIEIDDVLAVIQSVAPNVEART